MDAPRLLDRLRSAQVRRAFVSPGGLAAATVGGAGALLLGWPLVVATAIGATVWGGRIALAVPRRDDLLGIDPKALADPWRGFVERADASRRRYLDAVRTTGDGPLREQLADTGHQFAIGVHECWRAACGGQALTSARAAIDKHAIHVELTRLTWGPAGPPAEGSRGHAARSALEAQLESVERLERVIADTEGQLILLGARLDQAVAGAIELSVRRRLGDCDNLGDVVKGVVADMEALRLALDEIDDLVA